MGQAFHLEGGLSWQGGRGAGGRGREGPHKGIAVVTRWAWTVTPGGADPCPPRFRLWAEPRWWLQGALSAWGPVHDSCPGVRGGPAGGRLRPHTPPHQERQPWGSSSSPSASLFPASVTAVPFWTGFLDLSYQHTSSRACSFALKTDTLNA